jgi:hypothetical protein
MFKRVVLAAGIVCGAMFGLGAVSEAQAAGPRGHGHGHHGHGHHGHGGHGHWSHGHGHWHGHVHFRPYYPRPYYVPYVAPAPVYAYPQPYYYNRGPSLFLGSGGMTVRVPF